jgi:very-short-patch-repair endonuclease
MWENAKSGARNVGRGTSPSTLNRQLYLQCTDNGRNIVFKARPEPDRAPRKGMTKAEDCLWRFGLRAGQIKKYVFDRQVPVMSHVAGFMCKELRLIIDVEDSSLAGVEAEKQTASRQRQLEAEGFTILRLKDADVLNDMDDVRTKISSVIVSLEKKENGRDTKPLRRHSL